MIASSPVRRRRRNEAVCSFWLCRSKTPWPGPDQTCWHSVFGVAPSPSSGDLSMAELLAPLPLATDLGNGFPLEKALRNTLRLAEYVGLGGQLLSDAFYVSMMRYIGCT